MLGILRNPAFFRLWLAGLLSLLGSHMSRIALVLYLFHSGNTAVDLAFFVLLDTLPGALVAPLAGAVVDRASKRSVMVSLDLVRMGLMGALIWSPSLPLIYVVAALHSIVSAFFQPAKAASIPLIVDAERLVHANGLDQIAVNAVLVVGPVTGAFLFLHLPLPTILALDALSFLISALLVIGVEIPMGAKQERPWSAATTLAEIKEGWLYLMRHRLALHMALLFFTGVMCTGVWAPLAPFFIRDHLRGSDQILGWQLGILGSGAVVGGLWAPQLVQSLGKGTTLFLGLLAEGVSLTAYALVSNLQVSLAITFFWGIVVSLVVVPFYSLLQGMVEERFLGRVFAVIRQSENCALVLAMGVAALLHDRWGSPLILFVAGLFYLSLTAASSLTAGGRKLLATR